MRVKNKIYSIIFYIRGKSKKEKI